MDALILILGSLFSNINCSDKDSQGASRPSTLVRSVKYGKCKTLQDGESDTFPANPRLPKH